MFKKVIFAVLLTYNYHFLFAQDSFSKYNEFGIEFQQYPTGILLGAKGEFGFKAHHGFDFRIGYNFVDHRDQGKHNNEEGGGFGFTLGYRYYFNPQNTNFFLGARSDLWFNKIDWQDEPNLSGTTDIIVLQPTLIGGYVFLIHKKWVITPTLAFGYEINIVENGEPVGQGPTLLWGVNLNYRFEK